VPTEKKEEAAEPVEGWVAQSGGEGVTDRRISAGGGGGAMS
jgi:hypothetical protein